MNKKSLYCIWGALFILCAGLGFIQEPAGATKTLLFLLSMGFFIPPVALLFLGIRDQNGNSMKLIRNLSILSLLGTLIFMIFNILSALGPKWLGDILHSMLAIVSSPMMCCGNWFLSMFLWACLLMVSIRELKQLN